MSSEILRRRSTQRSPHPSSPCHRRRNRLITPHKLSNQYTTRSDNVFSEILPILSPRSIQTYPEDSRVLVSVTVEGSLGPIRTLMKLSSSVGEAIKLTIEEYTKEGRIPPIQTTASLYQLHLSSFNLESLDRSDTIGSIGSRTFYLRKIGCVDDEVMIPLQPCSFMVLFPAYISRGIAVILRRMCSMWEISGCLQYS